MVVKDQTTTDYTVPLRSANTRAYFSLCTRAQLAEGMSYQDATFRFALLERAPVACNFCNFSIWYRYASQLFTEVEIPSNIFVSLKMYQLTIIIILLLLSQ